MVDQDNTRQPSGLWKWTRRIIVSLFLLLAVSIIGGLIYAAVIDHRGQQAFDQAMAAVRAKGLLATPEQIYHEAHTGDDQAGRLYVAAFELDPWSSVASAELLFQDPAPLPSLGKPLDPAIVEKLATLAAENQRYFALLQAGLDGNGRLPLIDQWSFHTANLAGRGREAAISWLTLALLAGAQGKPAEALLDCRRALDMGSMVQGQMQTSTALMHTSIQLRTYDAIQSTLGRTTPDAGSLAALRRSLLDEEARLDVREMLRGDIAELVHLMGSLGKLEMSMETASIALYTQDLRILQGPTRSPDQIRFGVATRWAWFWLCPNAVQIPLAQRMQDLLADYDTAGKPLPELAAWVRQKPEQPPSATTGLSSHMVRRILQSKAGLRAAAIAMDVESYRLAQGRWPEKLAEVGDQLPVDPFTGGPMFYLRTDTGCVIYSAGPDLQDGHGTDSAAKGDDIAFRLLNPELRNKP